MTTPTLSTDSEAWKNAEAKRAFWQEHYSSFLKEYPDQFVAVRDGKVVAASPDLIDLCERLESQGLSPTETWIQFFNSSPDTMML